MGVAVKLTLAPLKSAVFVSQVYGVMERSAERSRSDDACKPLV
jgi:hypothetical protein